MSVLFFKLRQFNGITNKSIVVMELLLARELWVRRAIVDLKYGGDSSCLLKISSSWLFVGDCEVRTSDAGSETAWGRLGEELHTSW